jgi:drug/metabolite transporter (DMT)-like permease
MKSLLQLKIIPYITAGLVVFFWGSSFPAVRYTLQYYSPEALMLFRFIVASGVLLAYCIWKGVPLPKKKDLPMYAASGFIGLFLYMWAFTAGTAFVSAGISSFLIATAPIFTVILSIIFLKERASFIIWVGVLISFAGLVIVSFTQVTDMQLNVGVIMLLAASIFTSIYTIIQKYLLKKYTSMQTSAYSVVIGTLFMFIFFPALVREFPQAPLSANLIIIYLGVFPAAIAYFFWSLALSKAEKTVYVTSFLYLVPFISIVLSYLWLGEELSSLAILGGVIIIAGMVLTNVFKEKRK